MSNLAENRLTCNRIFRHLHYYYFKGFTGKIKISSHSGETWNFYLALGNLIWANGGNYPFRRWRRRFFAATGSLPLLNNIDQTVECWDYKVLRELSETHSLTTKETENLVKGIILEVLFDVVQAFEMPLYQQSHLSHSKELLTTSKLTGIGDGMQVESEEGVNPDPYYRLPRSLLPSLRELYKITHNTWKKWVEVGLAKWSPNEAPLLIKPQELQSRVSEKVYQNMSRALKGRTTVRDLSFKFKHGDDFLKLAAAIAPYVKKELIRFHQIQDLKVNQVTKDSYSTITASEIPREKSLLLAIDCNPKNQTILRDLSQKKGYNFHAIDDSIEALFQLKQNSKLKPKLIFFNPEISLITELEFCKIIRRLESLKDTSVIIYVNQPATKKREREAMLAGAKEFLNNHSFTYQKIKSILLEHGDSNGLNSNSNPNQHASFKLTMSQ
ncbi:UNVERIFIED_CONTAM: hypothetical protein BEN50_10895 [Euhalothece sp. KZN 001]